MRYYYTDPLKAAWMMKGHNFQFDAIMGWKSIFEGACDCQLGGELLDGWFEEKYYIHPDSHEMLKPQIGDIIEFYSSGKQVSIIVDNDNESVVYEQCLELRHLNDLNYEIIRRNNKAWFLPEIE